ncbi:peptidoglycan-binding domain-containing protein [Clostridium psychrophilum]|uniref:peptidoglycan-binding domain-containing protein n=1 Tax=Clostridium psychrophilum TaxID=132926 RepID=UPI001C0E5C23|nr:peptidoglycan-binding domain-containing protein [Clostridium psychrophilum]MBU3183055.1 peptidoglycan-binding protein [Clostridium psychrophilum]
MVLLKIGSTGADVKKLQTSLVKLGFNSEPIDGVFGPKTDAAVRAFQKDYGLVVDGIVEKNTWAAIDKALQQKTYFGTLIYTVFRGDNLITIAHNFNSTLENVLKFNKISNPDLIKLGQKIVIPLSPPEAIIYTVKSGDSLDNIAIKFGTIVKNLAIYNYLFAPYNIYRKQQLVVTASLK